MIEIGAVVDETIVESAENNTKSTQIIIIILNMRSGVEREQRQATTNDNL